ncbi:MAG TPA: right-handed parallel beta-helix repeat-containing protein [bacterium]|nr:right-handed parallel beta-helix repeat-containing protein [bacterium]
MIALNTVFRAAAALLVAMGLLALAPPADAAVFRVPVDIRTISQAIGVSAPGDTIRVVGNGGATYSDRLVISHDLVIEGGWRADFQTRDPRVYVSVVRDTTGLFERSVIRVDAAARVTLDGLTVLGGRLGVESLAGGDLVIRDCDFRGQFNTAHGFNDQPGAAIYVSGGTLLAERVTTRDGITAFAGAGLVLLDVQSATVRDCMFTRGTSRPFGPPQVFDPAPGGGLLVVNSTVLLDGVEVTQCAASLNEGGGLYAVASTVDMIRCEFRQCFSPTSGGAIQAVDCPRVTFVDGTLADNVGGTGGAIAAIRVGDLQVTGTMIQDNATVPASSSSNLTREGSGIWIQTCTFTLRNNTFDSNNSPGSVVQRGGGVWTQSSNGLVEDTVFRGELALGAGGAWYQVGGDVTLRRCEFRGNRSSFYGGASHIELGGRLRMEQTLVEGNLAKFGGGCSASFTGAVEFEHCTFTGNASENSGASFYLDTAASALISNTIACCAPVGGQINCSAATAVITHSAFWNDDAVNVRAEYAGTCPDPTGTSGNIRLDPRFCTGDPGYPLSGSSPCLGAASDGGDIGWAGAGCARPLNLTPESWGKIKARYSSPD